MHLMYVENAEIIIKDRYIKIAQFKDEWDVDVTDPEMLIRELKTDTEADLFTFMQRLPEKEPRFSYFTEWDNVAAIPISSFDQWWMKQIDDKVRNRARRAGKKGVIIKIAELNDELVKGIMNIYNETYIRQGRPFDNYGKEFQNVKKDLSDRLDRSIFVGAYYNDELIGFIKLINARRYLRTSGTIAKIEHRDKSPMNALIAKSVEICAENKFPYLVYGKLIYGNKGADTLSDFKIENGFKKIDLPRYYVPLNIKGKIGLKLNLHHGVTEVLPKGLVDNLIYLRKKWYSKKLKTK